MLAYNSTKMYSNSGSVPLSFHHCKDVDQQLLHALLSRQISAGNSFVSIVCISRNKIATTTANILAYIQLIEGLHSRLLFWKCLIQLEVVRSATCSVCIWYVCFHNLHNWYQSVIILVLFKVSPIESHK